MLNRGTSAIHTDDSRPWAVIKPRRAQTTNYTIRDANFIADNRKEKTIHHDNRHTISDSYNSTVFHAPVQGYVHSAKNGGNVNSFVQITNGPHPVGSSGDVNPIGGHDENPIAIGFSHSNRTRTIPQMNAAQMTNMSGEPNKEVTLAVGDDSSSAKVEQELQNLSPEMKAFIKSLERNTQGSKPDKRRNHTI